MMEMASLLLLALAFIAALLAWKSRNKGKPADDLPYNSAMCLLVAPSDSIEAALLNYAWQDDRADDGPAEHVYKALSKALPGFKCVQQTDRLEGFNLAVFECSGRTYFVNTKTKKVAVK